MTTVITLNDLTISRAALPAHTTNAGVSAHDSHQPSCLWTAYLWRTLMFLITYLHGKSSIFKIQVLFLLFGNFLSKN